MLEFFYRRDIQSKLNNAAFLSALLFLFRIVQPELNNVTGLVSEILTFGVILLWIIYAEEKLSQKKGEILSLIINAGVLTAIIFFIFSLADWIGAGYFNPSRTLNFFTPLLLILINSVVIGITVFIFTLFRTLYFLRQKKDLRFYFNVMIWFLAASFFAYGLIPADSPFISLRNALYVVDVLLFALNSTRVAWIAFLTKKQKVNLLILSVLLIVLFSLNFSFTTLDAFSSKAQSVSIIITSFSPGLRSVFNLLMLYGIINFSVVFFTTLFHLPTAAAFDRKAEEVASLTDISKLISQVFDFNELVESITKLTLKVSESDVAWLAIEEDGKLKIKAAENIGIIEAEKITLSLNKELKGIKDVMVFSNIEVKIKILESLRRLKFDSITIAPLKIRGAVNGFLFAGNFKKSVFDEDDLKTIGAFAYYAAIALENSLLIKESIEKERLEKELDIAREIQYKIIPSKSPSFKNIEISTLFIPAFEVGGDYFDFFKLDEETIAFIVADVSGKGISAAFVMAELKGIFETLLVKNLTPMQVLLRANKILAKSLPLKEFVTVTFGTLNIFSGEFKFARAGHTELLQVSGNSINEFLPNGIGIGLNKGKAFEETLEEKILYLKPEDFIVLFTDGVTEAQNKYLEMFGLKRLKKILAENSNKSLKEISEIVLKELSLFSKEHSQHDDITLLLLKWKGNKNKI